MAFLLGNWEPRFFKLTHFSFTSMDSLLFLMYWEQNKQEDTKNKSLRLLPEILTTVAKKKYVST